MNRRGFLATSVAALAGLTGCTGARESAPPSTSTTTTTTSAATTTTTSAATTTPSAPSLVTVDGGLVTVEFWNAETHATLEYYDESATVNKLRGLEPSRGEWVWANIYVTNDGGSKLMIDDVNDLTVDGVSETKSLPIAEGSLRESVPAPSKEMEIRGEYIPAGYSKPLRFLFDAPDEPHDFVWHYEGESHPIAPEK